MRRTSWTSPHSLLTLAGAGAFCFVASAIGGAATRPNLAPWYESLEKPWFNPPNLAFPIAWTILFALMAVALWRVLIVGEGAARRAALVAFTVQLALNVAWSLTFFGAQSPGAGLAVVVAMFLAIAWTIRRFVAVDGVAARLLYPYLAWVAFAAVLNAAIVILDR